MKFFWKVVLSILAYLIVVGMLMAWLDAKAKSHPCDYYIVNNWTISETPVRCLGVEK